MIINGFILGGVTFVAWATVFHKMPNRVKDWCAKHSLLTDAFFTFATYLVLSDALVSLLAAAWVGIMFEGYMYILRNKEDFDWLYDGIDVAKDRLNNLKQYIRKINRNYKEQKSLLATPLATSYS